MHIMSNFGVSLKYFLCILFCARLEQLHVLILVTERRRSVQCVHDIVDCIFIANNF